MSDTQPPATLTVPGAGARVGALRRGAHATQRDFTTLLDVLSRPGKIGRLVVAENVPAAALVACGLVDVEVPLHVLADDHGDGRAWRDAVHAATGAPRSEPEFARTVLALRPVTAAEIAALPRGDALNPELGARLFATVAELFDGEAPARGAGSSGGTFTSGVSGGTFTSGVSAAADASDGEGTILRLSGPGVRGERRLGVRGLGAPAVEAIAAANAGFPLGIDTFLVAPDGAVAGLPRTTRITVEGAAGGTNSTRPGE